ncbi:ABC transporter substrate-binding protein [Mesorhizobium sp.]|uniref:ABC transporter substrate-binding protein n=1 Tax=Mesorhizobium sp. TaxID=1871066 RepID=UPI0025ED221B|nr:ABC transporter substrate-binding protein [Mesorhizobium sp.]
MAAVALVACIGHVQPGQAGGHDIKLVELTPEPSSELDRIAWAVSSEPASLDWIRDADTSTGSILANVCEGLLRLAPDLTLEPALAKSFEHPDATTWIYHLHEGVAFHDGSPLTAADVVFSLKRNLDPKAGSFWSGAFTKVKSIEATGPLEVTVRLSAPDELFNAYMSSPAGIVEQAATVQRLGQQYGTPQGGVNCVGPYKFASWQSGQSITLARDDNYFDTKLRAKTKTVEFDIVRDPAAVVNGLLSGSLDGTWEVAPASIERLSSSGVGAVYYGQSTQGYNAIVMDPTGPLADPVVRKALSMAIDRQAIIDVAIKGAGQEQRAPAVPGSWGYERKAFQAAWDDIESATLDIEGAKKLLATTKAPAKPIVLATTNAEAQSSVIGAEIQSAAAKIGLKVELKLIPADQYYAVYTDAAARKGIDLYLTGWGTDFADPLQMYRYFKTGDLYNFFGFSNPEYDALVEQADAQSEPTERAQSIIKAQKIVVGQTLWIPLYASYNTVFLNARATGAPASYVQLHSPWAARIGAAK